MYNSFPSKLEAHQNHGRREDSGGTWNPLDFDICRIPV